MGFYGDFENVYCNSRGLHGISQNGVLIKTWCLGELQMFYVLSKFERNSNESHGHS